MIASMTWQQQQNPPLCLPPLYAPARLTATNISDIIYHQPACQSSHWVKKKNITAPSKRAARPLRTLMTRPRPHPSHDSSHPHPPTPLARTLLQCVILGLRCQKIIMPINFTHAGCSSFSLCPLPPPPLPYRPVPRWW